MSNVEVKKPFEILRFDILLLCGSLFWFDEVSYKKTAVKTKTRKRFSVSFAPLM